MNEPIRIDVVTEGDYPDCRNIGVFTTREKAEAAGGDTIEEWLLDNQQGAPGHYDYFFIVMDRDGNVRRSAIATPFGIEETPEFVRAYPKGNRDEQGCCYFHAWGTDIVHAIKIANEKRAQLIAEGKWGVK